MTARYNRRKRMPRCVAALLVAVAAFILPSPAWAIDLGEWIPGLKLSPFISEKIEYESNVFQARSHAKDDLILRTIPGVLAEYGTGPVALIAGYRAEILRFLDQSSQDTEHHFIRGQLRIELPRLSLNLRDDLTKTSDPPGSELTGRIQSTTNVLAPEAEYKLTDRFAIGTNYSWTRVDFSHVGVGEKLDRGEHLVGGSVFWKILPKTDLRMNYDYGRIDFETATSRDATRHVILVGVRGDLTAKLSSTFRTGFENRAGLKGFSGPVAGGETTYRPTERTRISLLTDRSLQESTFGNTPYFVVTSVALTAEHQFMPRLGANIRLTGSDNRYPTKETLAGRTRFRNDLLLGWGAGIEYELQKWLRLGLDYSHSRRVSNFKDFNSSDDKVAATVTLQF